MATSLFFVFGIGCPILAVVCALFLMLRLSRADVGTEAMQRVSEQIRKCAMAFLRIEYSILAVFVLLMFIGLVAFLPAGGLGMGVSFLVGRSLFRCSRLDRYEDCYYSFCSDNAGCQK